MKYSTSLATIWQTIRLHYGFPSTGSHFIDFVDIHLQPDEWPEDLYQRLVAFVEDNLLQRDSQILHHGDVTTVDEEVSPSLENMIVLSLFAFPDRPVHSDTNSASPGSILARQQIRDRNERGDLLEEFCVANELIVTNATFQQHPRRLYTWTKRFERSNGLDTALYKN